MEGHHNINSDNDVAMLEALELLGRVLCLQGRFPKAEGLRRRALERYKKVLGREHPSTFASVNNLGLVLESQGKYKEAEAIHRRALEAKEKSTLILGTEFDGYDSQWLKTGNMHILQTARTFLGFYMPCFIYLGNPSSRFGDIGFSRLPDNAGSLLVSLRALTLGTFGAGFGTAEAQLGVKVPPSTEVHLQREQDLYEELLKSAKGTSLILYDASINQA